MCSSFYQCLYITGIHNQVGTYMGNSQSDRAMKDFGHLSGTTVSFNFDPADDSIVVAIVEAIAAATEKNPTALPPLAEVIDPEALETCLSSGNDSVEISFEYVDRWVTLTGSGVGTIDQIAES